LKSNTTKGLIFVGAVLLALIAIGIIYYTTLYRPEEIGVNKLMVEVSENNVERVNVINDRIEVRFRTREEPIKDDQYDAFLYGRYYIEEYIFSHNQDIVAVLNDADADLSEDEIKQLKEAMIDMRFNDRHATSIWSILYPIGVVILIVIMAVFLFRSISGQNKQTMNFGKSKAGTQQTSKVRFNDVAGAEEEKVELQEVVEFLKAPAKFTKVGARIPRGVLLVGPPGTGKTLFAKAVAGEANVPFFSISGSDFVEMFVGVGASRVRDLFDQAKKNMPCIVFIDEIDAVGRQRGAGLGGGHDEREQTLNQLLVQMDGFETNEGIIVMAATNRADILDPALMRPGRFDRQIYVHIPDVRGREAIFKVHARNKPMANDVDFQVLARITSGFSGADIENLLNEAAILCARDNRTLINMNDINEGINKVLLGPQKKSRLVTEVDKRITAYHEVGHAVVGKICKHCGPVHEVSIIPRGSAGGYTMSRPEDDNRYESLNKLNDHLARIMGGRAAEELVIQDVTTGAVGDFKMATEVARKMVMEWGMSGNKNLGKVFYGSNQEVFLGRDYQSTHNYSEATAAEIDREVNRIVDDAHKRALEILTKHRKEMDVMARVLLECETIYTEEVDMIMDGASAEAVKDALNKRLSKKYENVNTSGEPSVAPA